MKIEHNNKFSISDLENDFLWRYIGLNKLLDLLTNQQIYFTRFDNFEDSLEGMTGRVIGLKAFTQGAPITHENINPVFEKELQEKLIQFDKNNRQEYLDSLTRSQQTQFASCWFRGSRESIAMWKLYSQSNGVAVKFKARQLTETIIAAAESYTNTDFEIFYYGPVEYKNIWPFDPNEVFDNQFNGLKKDKSYSHENEFRFVAVIPKTKKGQYKNFSLPIGQLKDYDLEILANPFMKDWEIENIKTLLKKFGLESKLQASKMEIRK